MACSVCGHEMLGHRTYRKVSKAGLLAGRREHNGRGVCKTCAQRLRAKPARSSAKWKRADLLHEVDFLLEAGETDRKIIAERIGLDHRTLYTALLRAARTGDATAVRLHERLTA